MASAVTSNFTSMQRVNPSEPVVNSSLPAAESALADRTHFVLPPRQWKKFTAALEAPPRDIPALRKLFAEPSIFVRK